MYEYSRHPKSGLSPCSGHKRISYANQLFSRSVFVQREGKFIHSHKILYLLALGSLLGSSGGFNWFYDTVLIPFNWPGGVKWRTLFYEQKSLLLAPFLLSIFKKNPKIQFQNITFATQKLSEWVNDWMGEHLHTRRLPTTNWNESSNDRRLGRLLLLLQNDQTSLNTYCTYYIQRRPALGRYCQPGWPENPQSNSTDAMCLLLRWTTNQSRHTINETRVQSTDDWTDRSGH